MNAKLDHLSRARQALRDAAAVVPHTDADGLAAGAIALRDRGEDASDAVLLGRGSTPWNGGACLPDGPLAVLDWGVRDLDRPGVMIDHHVPEVRPRDDQVVVSSHGERPAVPTAALMRRVVPESPSWVAAVGAVGDLGQRAFELEECAGAPRYAIKRLAALVNAPRRLPDGPVRTALALLVEHDSPTEALLDPRAEELEDAKRAWRAEFERVVRIAPQVGAGLAVIRMRSPCQVHPLVATTWARRLAPRVVLAANDDYVPGKVNFAVRGGQGSLRRLLRDALPGHDGEFARGHDRATGGSLNPEDFERLLDGLNAGSERPSPPAGPRATASPPVP